MEIILSAVVTLILVMDPFGNIPLFITALKKVSPERRNFILMRELAIALFIMIVFLFIGNKFLNLLGIAQSSMGIAGGIILFIISIKLVFNSLEDDSPKNLKEEEPFIVPFQMVAAYRVSYHESKKNGGQPVYSSSFGLGGNKEIKLCRPDGTLFGVDAFK